MKYLIVILTSIVLLSACNSKEGIKTNTINQDCEAKVISQEEIADLLATKNLTGYQFVDIRTPHEFAMGHLPNAINIPMKNFFDEDRYENVNKEEMLILYGDDASSPKMMGLLASHFKKGEYTIAIGGYDFLKDLTPKNIDDTLTKYDDELPLVDFQKEIDSIVARSGAAPSSAAKKKPTTTKPLLIRKKKAVSGGCG